MRLQPPPGVAELERLFDEPSWVGRVFADAESSVARWAYGDWNAGLEQIEPFWYERADLKRGRLHNKRPRGGDYMRYGFDANGRLRLAMEYTGGSLMLDIARDPDRRPSTAWRRRWPPWQPAAEREHAGLELLTEETWRDGRLVEHLSVSSEGNWTWEQYRYERERLTGIEERHFQPDLDDESLAIWQRRYEIRYGSHGQPQDLIDVADTGRHIARFDFATNTWRDA
jgi:hypothetical protein